MDLRSRFKGLLHSDHHYMTLAALECLPGSMQVALGVDAGLLLRHFCELPDVNWPMYGTLGCWEMDSTFCYDLRRDLQASFFLGHNPVIGTGCHLGHDRAGSAEAVPALTAKAVAALAAGRRREGLGFLGAACHYVEDLVTYPEQQTIHRRPMQDFEALSIDGYVPQRLFDRPAAAPAAIKACFGAPVDAVLSQCASGIRFLLRSGDLSGRNRLYRPSDELGAQRVADLIYTVFGFYRPAPNALLDVAEAFTRVDAEGLPEGYFVDREPGSVFQGYAGIEGRMPRGLDQHHSPGVQVRLAATGGTEIRWRQSLVQAMPLDPAAEYHWACELLRIDSGGHAGLRLLCLDDRWEPVGSIELSVEAGRGWQRVARSFRPPPGARLARLEFFSRYDPGSVLLDHWCLRDARCAPPAPVAVPTSSVRLELAPGKGHAVRDLSAFSAQNEPVTSIRGNLPGQLGQGDDFVFDGQGDFIEIAFHPLYQPLWPADALVISLEFRPDGVDAGELIMSANTEREPRQGWRLALQDGGVMLCVYGQGRVFCLGPAGAPLVPAQWHHLRAVIHPDGRLELAVDDTGLRDQAPFPREYSRKGHYIGADHGVVNFYAGRIRALVLEAE